MKFFQSVRIEPHSPSLINLENLTSNFREFVQICCGEEEEEREQDVGNHLSVSVLNLEFVYKKIMIKRKNLLWQTDHTT